MFSRQTPLDTASNHSDILLRSVILCMFLLTLQAAGAKLQVPRVSAVPIMPCKGQDGSNAPTPRTCAAAQVGRHCDPLLDAACLSTIREAVGPAVRLRADANRAWGRAAAIAFGTAAEAASLEYIEEPVADVRADLAAFHQATGLPVALDESVDAGEGRGPQRTLLLTPGQLKIHLFGPRSWACVSGEAWHGARS